MKTIVMNYDDTWFNPPIIKDFKDYIKMCMDKSNCSEKSNRCEFCEECPNGRLFTWPSNKKQILIEQAAILDRYNKIHKNHLKIPEHDFAYCMDIDDDCVQIAKHFVTKQNVGEYYTINLCDLCSELFDEEDTSILKLSDKGYSANVYYRLDNSDDQVHLINFGNYYDFAYEFNKEAFDVCRYYKDGKLTLRTKPQTNATKVTYIVTFMKTIKMDKEK